MGLDRRYLGHGCWLVGVCSTLVVQQAGRGQCEEDAVDVEKDDVEVVTMDLAKSKSRISVSREMEAMCIIYGVLVWDIAGWKKSYPCLKVETWFSCLVKQRMISTSAEVRSNIR